jgi:amidase
MDEAFISRGFGSKRRTSTKPSDELAYVTAHELAARIRRRELSPVEVVEAFIRRIEARNPSLNALVYLGFDSARTKAKQAECELMTGEQLGPFQGRPVGA